MQHDPFGNLKEWGEVLDLLFELSEKGQLVTCQPGLIRILRYKGNWRLREEVLKRVREIKKPTDALILEVLSILDDDNIYYDARILAGEALVPLLKNMPSNMNDGVDRAVIKVTEKLKNTPHPPFFNEALTRLYSEVRSDGCAHS